VEKKKRGIIEGERFETRKGIMRGTKRLAFVSGRRAGAKGRGKGGEEGGEKGEGRTE